MSLENHARFQIFYLEKSLLKWIKSLWETNTRITLKCWWYHQHHVQNILHSLECHGYSRVKYDGVFWFVAILWYWESIKIQLRKLLEFHQVSIDQNLENPWAANNVDLKIRIIMFMFKYVGCWKKRSNHPFSLLRYMHYPSAKVKGLVDYFLERQEQQFTRSDWRFDNLSASYDQSAILLTLRVKSAQVVEWSVSTIARSPFRDFLYSHLNFFFNWFLLTFITILTPSIFFYGLEKGEINYPTRG